MSKAHSMDLRARLVRAVETEGMSRRAAAERFGVAASTAVKWPKRVTRTGSVTPGRVEGRRPRTIAGVHRDWLGERCRDKPGVRLVVLPQYSPDLNPIEQFFAKIKHGRRTAARHSFDTISDAIGTLLETVSKTECANYLVNAGYASK